MAENGFERDVIQRLVRVEERVSMAAEEARRYADDTRGEIKEINKKVDDVAKATDEVGQRVSDIESKRAQFFARVEGGRIVLMLIGAAAGALITAWGFVGDVAARIVRAFGGN